MRFGTDVSMIAGALGILAAACGAEERRDGRPSGPSKLTAVERRERKRLLAAESAAQKALRAELKRLAARGQKVYFNSNAAGNNDIYVMGCDGENLKRLTSDPSSDSYPHCSPDGRKVLFASDRIKLQRKKPIPPALQSIPVDPKVPLNTREQRWNRYKTNSVVWMMNADGSDPKPVAYGTMPHWSPDGRRFVYSVVSRPFPNQAAIMDLEKRTELCLVYPKLRNCGMPCFTPDGRHIIGSNGAAFLIRLNAALTEVESILKFDNGHPCNGEISRDGKYWTAIKDTHKCLGGWLWYLELDGAYHRKGRKVDLRLQHARGSVNYFPDFSPCGKYYIYCHAEQQAGVKSWELKDGQEIFVTRFPRCDVTVRLTWNGAASQHPQWVAPPR